MGAKRKREEEKENTYFGGVNVEFTNEAEFTTEGGRSCDGGESKDSRFHFRGSLRIEEKIF